MKKHIIDFFWKDKKAYVVLRNLNNDKIDRKELVGLEFNWKFEEKRKCPGTYKLMDWKYEKCEEDAYLLDEKYRRCRLCEEKIGFKKVFIYDGEVVNDDVRQYLNQQHFVYLAYFPPSIVKVGTASRERKLDRMYDQDAYAFIYIAKTSGLDIQQIERFISKNYDVVESVTLKHKLKYLKYEKDKKFARKLLLEKATKIKANTKEFTDFFLNKTKVNFLVKNTYSNVEFLEEFEEVGGRVVDVRGRLIILNHKGNIFAIDGKKLPGKVIKESDEEVILETKEKQIELL